jgi:hypothetical protein
MKVSKASPGFGKRSTTMKMKKKTLISLSIVVGIAVLATTAVAGAVADTAYSQLKDAVKATSAAVAAGSGNYTESTEMTLSDNGTVLYRMSSSQKTGGGGYENWQLATLGTGKPTLTYTYNDGTQNIWYDQSSNTYYVNQYTTPIGPDGAIAADKERLAAAAGSTVYNTNDPLANENMKDIERIVDAFVGNLKDYVSVTVKADGSKVFAGSLSEAQIPALVNAIASFATKQYLTQSGVVTPVGMPGVAYDASGNEVRSSGPLQTIDPDAIDNQFGLPTLTGDIFVRSVSGTATTLPDGVLTDVDLAVVLSGTDDQGAPHDLSLGVHVTMSAIGTTVVTAPDLTGKKVQVSKTEPGITENQLTDRFVGTYCNDVVSLQDGKYVRIGQRFIEITSITADTVVGKYYEVYDDSASGDVPLAFDFTAPNTGYYSITFSYTDTAGTVQQGSMYFDPTTASVNFQAIMTEKSPLSNSVFPMVFD